MAKTATRSKIPASSSNRSQPLARESSLLLSRFIDRDLEITISDSSQKITLPAEAVRILVNVLTQLGQGHALTLIQNRAELTTRQAAEFLGVSRPFIIKQLEAGTLPYRKVGTHRRVLLEDLIAYKRETHHKRLGALNELSALDQELGLQ